MDSFGYVYEALEGAKNTYLAKKGKNEFFRKKVTRHHLGTTNVHQI